MLCFHRNRGWPRRSTDGLDYQRCLECGALIQSKIQFGNERVAGVPSRGFLHAQGKSKVNPSSRRITGEVQIANEW